MTNARKALEAGGDESPGLERLPAAGRRGARYYPTPAPGHRSAAGAPRVGAAGHERVRLRLLDSAPLAVVTVIEMVELSAQTVQVISISDFGNPFHGHQSEKPLRHGALSGRFAVLGAFADTLSCCLAIEVDRTIPHVALDLVGQRIQEVDPDTAGAFYEIRHLRHLDIGRTEGSLDILPARDKVCPCFRKILRPYSPECKLVPLSHDWPESVQTCPPHFGYCLQKAA